MIPSVPEPEWYSDYQRARAMFLPIGPEVEIARDADWSVSVSRAQDGFCISHARSEGGGGYAIGGLPSPDDRSQHVVADLANPASRKEGVGFIVGIVTPNVARVEVGLRDGTRISAPTEAAPDALEADLRTFVIRTPPTSNRSARAIRHGRASMSCSRPTTRFWSDCHIHADQASSANARAREPSPKTGVPARLRTAGGTKRENEK